ncbi:MAG: hypothetical protein ABFS46_05385 [Myxococcota bacterium]
MLIPLSFAGFGFEQEHLNEQLLIASALLNWPHFTASFALLYGSREQVRQHRFVSVVFPLLLVAGGLGVVVAAVHTNVPVLVASLLTSAYLAWHYTGQAFGMVNVFARIEGNPLDAAERWPIRLALRLLLAFHVAWIHHLFPPGVFPSWFVAFFETAYRVLLAMIPVAFALGAFGLVRYGRRIGRVPAARVVVPFAATVVWYVFLAAEPGGLILVQLFHSLQYLGFPIRVEVNDSVSRAQTAGRPVTSASRMRSAALYYGFLVLAGILALYLAPIAARDASEWAFGLAAPGAAAAAAVLMLVNVHHYLTDATIWKLRDPRVRTAVLGHLPGTGGGGGGNAR